MMSTDRVVAGAVVACIVGLTLATGPVGPIDIGTDSGGLEDPGTGSATVEVVSAPDEIALEPSNDGQELLHLSVPSTTISVSNVTGNPILTYTMNLDEIGLSTDTLRFLGQTEKREFELTKDRRTFQPHEVQNLTEAELSVTLRGENLKTVFERTIPVDRP